MRGVDEPVVYEIDATGDRISAVEPVDAITDSRYIASTVPVYDDVDSLR